MVSRDGGKKTYFFVSSGGFLALSPLYRVYLSFCVCALGRNFAVCNIESRREL